MQDVKEQLVRDTKDKKEEVIVKGPSRDDVIDRYLIFEKQKRYVWVMIWINACISMPLLPPLHTLSTPVIQLQDNRKINDD